MAGEIAQAFVRIRPNTAGFAAEAEGGIKSAFGRLAKLAGIAFAAEQGINFGKDIVGHAADIEKQIEVIRAEFGKGADAILSFNEKGAAAFGISAHVADTAAARFGILFKNLGIAPELASKMTLGFEHLAGSLASIRGLDPALVLKNLPLAVAGNLRSLKQLGISTDQTQLKVAAFKLGLISSVKDALTPATRAEAIYAVATAHLGEFQAQAAAHSGDLRNRTRELAAEWDNAKDSLGRGLIPAVSALVSFFGTILPPAVAATKRAFGDIAGVVRGLAGFLAPAIQPIIDEISRIRGALSRGGISEAVAALRSDFSSLSPAGRGLAIILASVAGGFVALQVAAAPPLLILTGLVIAFREAYTHSARFRDIVALAGDAVTTKLLPALGRIADVLRPAFAALGRIVGDALVAVAHALSGARPLIDTLISRFRDLSPVGRALAGVLGGVALALAAIALSASPLTIVVAAVAGLGFAFVEAFRRSASFRKIADSVLSILPPAKEVESVIRGSFSKALEEVAAHRRVFEVLAGAVAGAATGFVALRVATIAWTAVTRVAAAVQAAFDLSFSASPVGLLVVALGALVGTLAVLATKSASVRATLSHILDGISSAAAGAASKALRGIGDAIDFVGQHKKVFEILGGALAGAAAGFVALRVATAAWTGVTRIATAVQAAFDGALTANPIGLIVVAVGALVGALAVLYFRSATVRRVLDGLFDGVRAAARAALPVLESIGRGFLAAGRTIAGFVTGTLIPAFRGVVGFVTGTLIPTFAGIASALAPVFRDVAQTLATLFSGAVAVARTFVAGAKAVISGAAAILTPFIKAVEAGIAPFAAVVVGGFRTATSIVRAIWTTFGATLVRVVRIDLSTVVAVVRSALRVVRGIINVLVGLITGDWTKAWNGLKDILGGVFSAVKALVSGFGKELLAIASGALSALEKALLIGLERVVSLLAKIPTSFKIFGQTIGFTNPFKGVDDSLKKHISDLGESTRKAVTDQNAKTREHLRKSTTDAVKAAAAATADVVGRGADSAEAGSISRAAAAKAEKAATEAAAAAKKTISGLTDSLNQTVAAQDAGIAKARRNIASIGTAIAAAIKQEATDVADAVGQAKQNLLSIGTTLSDAIGQILDKPLADAQTKISALGNQKTLENLRRSILLPGGKGLSANPATALAELRNLAAQSGNVNRAAIQAFILQYQGAVLAVKQDQVNVTKAAASRQIADLTDSFNRGQITVTQYKKRILAILTADHVSYKKAGALLGTAFANGFRDEVSGLFKQAVAIQAVPAGRRGTESGAQPTIVKPLETLQKDQRQIATLTHRKQDAQTALQVRIAKAAEKTAKLQEQIASVALGPSSAILKNPGAAGKQTKALTGTTK